MAVDESRVKGMPSTSLFCSLKHLEVTCTDFPVTCFTFIAKLGTNLQSVKVMSLQGLSSLSVEDWINSKCFPKVHTFILYQAPKLSFQMINLLLEHMPSLTKFGDLNSFDTAERTSTSERSQDIKRLASKVKEKEWDLILIDSSQENFASCEKDFTKMLSLHWFYLTEAPTNHKNLGT